ncbi:MAG: phenylacetate--CoA ligase family protein [Chloroflexi bacterium]|nr:phenylacetate--CoA ligase family protein [Chloroflexota bacterium]
MQINYWDKDVETAGREQIQAHQLSKVRTLLERVLESNAFYRRRLTEAGLSGSAEIRTLEDFARLPFLKKNELVADQTENPPFGTNLTFPLEKYIKYHQTSGTTGRPYRCLDSEEDWRWWMNCWAFVHTGVGVTYSDRLYFAFSFGPFVGFWSSWDGARSVGALAIPGGGMGSLQRLQTIVDTQANTLVCTPSYALRLAEEARQSGMDPAATPITRLIHAGEPGASIPATKKRIETAWGAKCYDHHGMTEVGAMSFECVLQPGGIHLLESEYIFEVVDPATNKPADEGELIVTNLGRVGMPVIRYRTGDRVRITRERCECGRTFARLQGGIIGRVDDMMIVRGINVFPTSVEAIVREFQAVDEFFVEVFRRREMDEMEVRIEVSCGDAEECAAALTSELSKRLAFRPIVTVVESNTLPRFEMKARRFVDRRKFE